MLKKIRDSNPFVRTILMTAFEIDDKKFQEYTKMKIINGFLQKPIALHDLIRSGYSIGCLRTSKKISFALTRITNYIYDL